MTASLSVMLFVGLITATFFFIGLRLNLSNHELANMIIKRCAIIFGLFLLSLDFAMLATIADNAGLGISQEIFRYLWIINWTIYLSIMAMMWSTTVGSLKLWGDIAKRKSYGEE